ncbi:MAG: hypothetical protein RL026_2559 [Pseudomonadota bacterium]|jgi:hypothetical protein
MKVRVLAVGAAVLAVSAGMASAHHSFAMFDNEKEMTIEGVVKEFQWTNPHIWIQVNVAGSDGKLVEWSIEGGSPNGLRRNGWSKNSFQPGDKVVMKIHPLKDGSPGGSFMTSTVNGAPLNSRGE